MSSSDTTSLQPFKGSRSAEWASIKSTDEVRKYFESKGKSIEEFEADVENSRAIHGLDSYNVPKSISESGNATPPEGWESHRFEGSEAKWLRLTAQDRAIVTGLAQVANEDLSIHLYNAHVLGSRVNAHKSSSGKGKKVRSVWPPRSWTKWPMKPEHVPRSQFKQISQSEDEHVWRSTLVSQNSTEDLQEAIIAVILKQAKEQFVCRNAEVRSSTRGSILHGEVDTQGSASGASSESSSIEGTVSPLSQNSSMSQSEKEEAADDSLESPKRKRRASDSSRNSQYMPSPGVQPVHLADDDKATALLAPIARHMLSNIEKLLAGLHRQRQAYITATIRDSDTIADDNDANSASSRTSSKSTPTSPSKRPRRDSSRNTQSPPKRPKLARHHSTFKQSSRNRSNSSLQSSTSTDSHRTRESRLGQRDWSDIIGIASLTGGFSQKSIEQAAARCALLFDEGVSFRTLGVEGGGKADGEFDILPQGRRESAPQKRPNKVRKVRSKEMDRSGALFCHVKWCKRHTKGFPRLWHLNKHMKGIHGIPTPKELELAAQRKRSERTDQNDGNAVLDGYEAEGSDDDMEDGVHVDGYMREIRVRPGWSRYWGESSSKGKKKKKRRKSARRDGKRSASGTGSGRPMEEHGRKHLQMDGAVETEASGESFAEEDEEDVEEEQIDSSNES